MLFPLVVQAAHCSGSAQWQVRVQVRVQVQVQVPQTAKLSTPHARTCWKPNLTFQVQRPTTTTTTTTKGHRIHATRPDPYQLKERPGRMCQALDCSVEDNSIDNSTTATRDMCMWLAFHHSTLDSALPRPGVL